MRRLMRRSAWILAAAMALAAVGWWLARPVAPDAFYETHAGATPRPPGTLLRQATFGRGVPPGAQGWRILYATTRADGVPAVASAIVLASNAPHSEPRPVIAWTHGTTGVAPGCAPSLLEDPFAHVPALRQLIDSGWIYVATDYVGLGTRGPHPYLIGEGQARSVLDSIRAARSMDGVRASDAVVVWGHSQGGHAALWTGILAPSYAPDVEILGVAALAPASDLRALIEAVHRTPVGRIISSFVLRSYSETYPDVSFDAYSPAPSRWLARDIAGRCMAGRGALVSVAEALAVGDSVFGTAPTSGPLGERLAENTPDRALGQPLLIAQGLADELVLPEVQSAFVQARCGAGQALEYRTYAGRDHLSVVAPDSPLTRDLVRWTRDRFDGAPWTTTCDGPPGQKNLVTPMKATVPMPIQ